MIYSHRDYEKKPFRAATDIADILRSGSLMLFLGSGVSRGFGLPEWALLVARVIGKGDDQLFVKKLTHMSDRDKGNLIGDKDDGSPAYVDAVRCALYQDVPENLSDRMSRSPLLLAVAALLMGSCRGRISSVVTYNFDDLLQQYLRMLGYSVCVRKRPTDITTWADVEINHIHGYLPQSGKDVSEASEIIFSEKSYRNRRAFIDEGWSSYVEHSLYSKIGLFIGLSGDDGSVIDLLKRAKEKISRGRDYTGYWLITPDAYKRNCKAILEVGMCPIRLQKKEFSKFVFTVCQEAGKDQ